MKKLQKEFDAFDEAIRREGETATLIDKREKLRKDMEDYFPVECTTYGISVNKSDLRFIHQGSYKIGTAISNPGKSVDLDYAVIMPLDTNVYKDPRDIKKAARAALEIKNIRIPKIKEPCVTVAYHSAGEEYMHIDFPLYADHENQLYLARGKETSLEYVWEPADPDGLNDYFFAEFKDRAQLKRIVRYIKKWKQEKYNNSNNSHETPPSIGLTLLACNNYANYTYDGDDDLSSLYYTMKTIQEQFSVQRDINGEITSASIACNLPVTPFSDVFYKMRTSPQHMITLYNRIRNAVSNLCNAMNLEESHEAAKYVQKVLGDEFEIPAKQAKDAAAVVKREYNFGYGE